MRMALASGPLTAPPPKILDDAVVGVEEEDPPPPPQAASDKVNKTNRIRCNLVLLATMIAPRPS